MLRCGGCRHSYANERGLRAHWRMAEICRTKSQIIPLSVKSSTRPRSTTSPERARAHPRKTPTASTSQSASELGAASQAARSGPTLTRGRTPDLASSSSTQRNCFCYIDLLLMTSSIISSPTTTIWTVACLPCSRLLARTWLDRL
jgi:hypothetical protein